MTQRTVSLFSGAGGLDLGLLRAGFQPGLMVDASSTACSTLRRAMPTAGVLPADIHDVINAETVKTLADVAPVSLVAGQPPLVPGPVKSEAPVDPDSDNPQLLYRFMDVVAQGRPTAFVLASIPALAGERWNAVLERLRHTARTLGYDTFAPVIGADEYGTPQRKDRLFLIGMPKGTKLEVSAAVRVPSKVSAGTALRALEREILSGKRAIRDLPCPSGVHLHERPVVRASAYSGQLLTGPGRIIDLRRPAPALPSAIGGNKTPVLDMTQLEFDATPWIEGYHAYLKARGVPGEYGSEGKMRRLSLRECAVVQGFPADYPFSGSPLAQFKQVGSAVPPQLGEAVGRAVMAGLR